MTDTPIDRDLDEERRSFERMLSRHSEAAQDYTRGKMYMSDAPTDRESVERL